MNHNLAENENTKLNVEYYGADFPVDVLVKRMEAQDFIIPGFQRKYVWKEEEGSRFIESLLLGLPTPALFLARDKFSSKYLVIDGQQRLKTLQYFYKESFPEGKVFKLKGVIPALSGLTYSSLPPSERRNLDNAIIHCIIISENYDSNGIFYLFERLNTTGTSLSSQEIRNAIYHGAFSELLQELVKNETWRHLYGKDDNRANEQELILRFLALHFNFEEYKGNMVDFLNDFMLENQNLEQIPKTEMQDIFLNTIQFLDNCFGSKVFYHKKSFNSIIFEHIMLLTAKELKHGLKCETFKKFYEALIRDEHFWSLSKYFTTSRKNLMARLDYVCQIYKNLCQTM
ncbi:hypothetical protein Cylst_1572 [Cylindrospermum stagnale PCC 7417]|uniref:GmrSD restriction endonucleases N-terminal domain-containing protein n=1 Tax=Cylindrospermum stagnale PCC 7417 TaxID=56107 RepID=K9WWE7_9NOST|nr:DUF262 domain-containing protein [Cylindrospermum stagnale]AFZ23852.1 hypothetical protein Cylst_1572 [Cylindrospermum stagnale PCC 7417]